MKLDLSEEHVKILLALVRQEMNGICGALGYQEQSKIKDILEEDLVEESPWCGCLND